MTEGRARVSEVAWVWLYTRRRESVRIVVQGRQLVVCGPGSGEVAHACDSDEAARLQQIQIEQQLLLDGWTLDRLISERRSGRERRDDQRAGHERRRPGSEPSEG